MVGLNPDAQRVLTGECKWSVKPVGTDVLKKLEEKSYEVDFGFQVKEINFILFSKSGFTKELIDSKPANCLLCAFNEPDLLADVSDFP